jgi:polysaccharide export outer membrane protein
MQTVLKVKNIQPEIIGRFRGLAGGLMVLAVAVLLAFAGAGCRSENERANYDYYLNGVGRPVGVPTPEAQGTVDYSTNLLHEGDVVDINFQYSTNFNTVQKINLDGELNLSSVGTVKASGRTVMGLQEEIARLYKPQVKDDVVTVKLISSGATVSVGGSVLRPGPVELTRPLTVLEAVMSAGGFDTSRAKLSAVKVLRIKNGRQTVYTVNLKRVLDGREAQPFFLEPFDIIYVPAKTFNY